jgi:hypothetical protein
MQMFDVFRAAIGAFNVASAAHMLSACLWNRPIQNCPRWYGIGDSLAATAAALRVWPHSRRATKNSATTVIPKKIRQGELWQEGNGALTATA